jgi:Lamin Tail Domain
MPSLLITRAHPNPSGKDRNDGHATNDQLNQEWIEIGNVGDRSLPLDGLTVRHYTFDSACQRTGEANLVTLRGPLDSGWSFRLHTGVGEPSREGTNRHGYLVNRNNFVWNNACGDTVVLRNSDGTLLDWASYDRNPPEGTVLKRIPGTNKLGLVASSRTA